MIPRSLLITVMSLIGCAMWTYHSHAFTTQEKTAQPVSVFVAALKGDCGLDRRIAINFGQVMIAPLPYNIEKTLLSRFDDDLDSKKMAEDEFSKNRAFRVVEKPTQADFVFCLCARYVLWKIPVE